MKTPHKIYKRLRGKKSRAGRAFEAVSHPMRTLRSVFGWDTVARDVAEGYNLAPSKYNIFRVWAIVKNWGKVYRGPGLSTIFRRLGQISPTRNASTRRLEPD